jgi:hypothetical protein
MRIPSILIPPMNSLRTYPCNKRSVIIIFALQLPKSVWHYAWSVAMHKEEMSMNLFSLLS